MGGFSASLALAVRLLGIPSVDVTEARKQDAFDAPVGATDARCVETLRRPGKLVEQAA
jgi:hypothetical protein